MGILKVKTGTRWYLLVGLIFLFTRNSAQLIATVPIDTVQSKRLLTIVNFNREQTYTTLGSGLGNQVLLIFEAQFSPSYFIGSRSSKWILLMNPQVQMRMLNKPSWPIQVPSYHFYVHYYRSWLPWRKLFAKQLIFTDAIWFAAVMHHSNGQSGALYLNDSTQQVDLIQGNFSVNSIQVGLIAYALHNTGKKYFSLRQIRLHAEWFPPRLMGTELRQSYGLKRVFGSFSFGGPWREEKLDWANRLLQCSSVDLKTGWIFGEFEGYEKRNTKRWMLDLTYKYAPPWFDEVAFFIRFYSGQDYYNVFFQKQLVTLTAGITTNTIKLSSSTRFVGRK